MNLFFECDNRNWDAVKNGKYVFYQFLEQHGLVGQPQLEQSNAQPTANQAAVSAVQSNTSRALNKQRKKRGMNDDTREKLNLLSSIREQNIKNDEVTIAWTTACQRAKIDPDTARRYAKELRAKWNDSTYHAEFAE